MADSLLQRNAREQREEAERQERMREIANGTALGMQMIQPSQIIEIPGHPVLENLDRPDGDFRGGLTLRLRVPGGPIAHRVHLAGQIIDELHELLHSDPPVEEDGPTEEPLPENLDEMTIGQLRELAESRGLQARGKPSRALYIAMLRGEDVDDLASPDGDRSP